MTFWIGIVVGCLFAWQFAKTGFYQSWMILFNLVISTYLAVFLRPVLVESFAIAGRGPYAYAITMLATATAAFMILHGILHILFTSQFSASFPKILDILGSGFLGFWGGILIWSFAGLLICITPFSQTTLIRGIDFENEVKQCNTPYLCWWFDLVNTAISRQEDKVTGEAAIEQLFKDVKSRKWKRRAWAARPAKTFVTAEPNEAAEPNRPDTPETITDHNKPAAPSGR